jgi:hypothetical protein
MKKFLTAGVLALTVAAFSQQQASAWINCRFGIGFNWNWSCGGNSILWGAYRNGQPPGYGYPMLSSSMTYPSTEFYAPAPALATTPAAPRTWYGYPGYQTVNFAPDFDFGFSYFR